MNITEKYYARPVDVNESPWVTLNDSQIKNLPITPVEIIEHPGPLRIITPLHAMILFDTTRGAYDNGNVAGAALNIGLGATLSLIVFNSYLRAENYDTVIPAGDYNLTAPSVRAFTRTFDGVDLPLSIVLVTDAGTALTGGHPLNTMKVKVWFSVVGL